MLSIKSDNLNQSRLHSQKFMKLARAAYARVLIIPHSVSVEHRVDYTFFKFAKGRSLSLFNNKWEYDNFHMLLVTHALPLL